MDKSGWLYIAACLLVPAAWGITSAWLFAKIDARRKPKTSQSPAQPPVDYSI
ncbi:MAG: hypothetical protein JKY56_05970 [Kofleriaceae bacterium]|nr:hypothetical protein [Kofleriaceae bacterium]